MKVDSYLARVYDESIKFKEGKMLEILKAIGTGRVKIGRRVYHLYDCAGKEIIDGEYERLMHPYYAPKKYDCIIKDAGNGWYSLYINPKHR